MAEIFRRAPGEVDTAMDVDCVNSNEMSSSSANIEVRKLKNFNTKPKSASIGNTNSPLLKKSSVNYTKYQKWFSDPIPQFGPNKFKRLICGSGFRLVLPSITSSGTKDTGIGYRCLNEPVSFPIDTNGRVKVVLNSENTGKGTKRKKIPGDEAIEMIGIASTDVCQDEEITFTESKAEDDTKVSPQNFDVAIKSVNCMETGKKLKMIPGDEAIEKIAIVSTDVCQDEEITSTESKAENDTKVSPQNFDVAIKSVNCMGKGKKLKIIPEYMPKTIGTESTDVLQDDEFGTTRRIEGFVEDNEKFLPNEPQVHDATVISVTENHLKRKMIIEYTENKRACVCHNEEEISQKPGGSTRKRVEEQPNSPLIMPRSLRIRKGPVNYYK